MSVELIGSSLISFMLSFMLMKAWLPFAPKRPGDIVLEVRLGLVQRLFVHRTQAILLLLYVIIGTISTDIHLFLPGTQVAALGGLLLVIMLPLRYVFTTQGVRLNSGVTSIYKDFRRLDAKDVRQRKGPLQGLTEIILRGKRTAKGSNPSTRLFIPTSDVQEVTRMLKRLVR